VNRGPGLREAEKGKKASFSPPNENIFSHATDKKKHAKYWGNDDTNMGRKAPAHGLDADMDFWVTGVSPRPQGSYCSMEDSVTREQLVGTGVEG